MSFNNEKTTFGVTIERTVSQTDPSTGLLHKDVALYTPTTQSPALSRQNSSSPSATRSTPFYAAQPEHNHLTVPMKSQISVIDTDLEKGSLTPSPTTPVGGSRLDLPSPYLSLTQNTSRFSVKECSMWPSKQTLQQKKREEKAAKRGTKCCGLGGPVGRTWGNMDKRQRLWFKILVALFVIAVAIALGIGISKAVGGGVWVSDHQSSQIPNSN